MVKQKKLSAKLEWNKKMGVDIEMVEGGKLRADDIVIPVMGATGVGKSSFINSLFDPKHPQVEVSQGLRSCTVAMKPVIISPTEALARKFATQLAGRRLVLVDTPGFGDTFISDMDILARISNWLASAYSTDMKLGGLIYLQDITKTISDADHKNVHVFQKLCGEDAFKSIVLGTTIWSDLPSREIGEVRHKELKTLLWGELVAGGSHVIPIDDKNPGQAIEIILANLEKRNAPNTVLIQNELVELKKSIPNTAAGKALMCTMDQVIKMQRENGTQATQDLRRLVVEANKLKIPLSRRIRAFFGI